MNTQNGIHVAGMERPNEKTFPYRVVVYRMYTKGRGVKGRVLSEVKCRSYSDALDKKSRLQAEYGVHGIVEIFSIPSGKER